LNSTRTIQLKLKNSISAFLALQKTLSRSDLHRTPFTRMNKGNITPERICKNSKTVAQLQQNSTSTFTKIKALLEQAHLKIFLKNLSKTHSNTSSRT